MDEEQVGVLIIFKFFNLKTFAINNKNLFTTKFKKYYFNVCCIVLYAIQNNANSSIKLKYFLFLLKICVYSVHTCTVNVSTEYA